jgi:hypothetical protein
MSPERVADQLSRLREDARRAARAMEPGDEPLPLAQAEADYIDTGLLQLAAELRGICTVCTLGEEMNGFLEDGRGGRRWLN